MKRLLAIPVIKNVAIEQLEERLALQQESQEAASA